MSRTAIRSRSTLAPAACAAFFALLAPLRANESVERAVFALESVARGNELVAAAVVRSNGFESRVTARGIEVEPASGAEPSWSVTLRTSAFGRGTAPGVPETAAFALRGERAELDHGAFVEWYAVVDRGVEHGWTIGVRPAGEGPLWIGLELGGDLEARISEDGLAAKLVDARGVVQMNYAGLYAFDARGEPVEARLEARASGLGIRVDDAGAVYPLTVDPVLSGLGWTAESNQVNCGFGYSSATAGDVNRDGFSDVIVGAPSYDGGQGNEGRAYVYLGSPSGLAASAAWTFESDQTSSSTGFSVATAGDVNGDGYSDVIVGAPLHDGGEVNEGRAFVFHGSMWGLSTTVNWFAESNVANAQFGSSVASAGDVNADGYSDVIVGAPSFANGESGEGRAYLYLGSATGLAATPAWTFEGNTVDARLGASVAWAGDVNGDSYGDVVIGSHSYTNTEFREGRILVFHGSASGLSPTISASRESDRVGAELGVSVSTAGDVNADGYADVIAGAVGFEYGENSEGAAYVYLGGPSGLSVSVVTVLQGNSVGAFSGRSVSTAGDVNGDGYADVAVGANSYGNGHSLEGRIQVHLGYVLGVEETPAWSYEPNVPGARLGQSVGLAGDVDGDGFCDVITGAPDASNDQSAEGKVAVFTGLASLLPSLTPSAVYTSVVPDDYWGARLDWAGDVNGDGYSDVVFSSAGQADDYVRIQHGGPGLLTSGSSWTLGTGTPIGLSPAGAGDVNGDGYDDVILGSPGYDNVAPNAGRVDVLLGSPSGIVPVSVWNRQMDQAQAVYGASVSSAGDVNGDGYDDVAIGAPRYDAGDIIDGGLVEVFLGSANGLAATPHWLKFPGPNDDVGGTVAAAGDVNRDGYDDVIISIVTWPSNRVGFGVHYGSPTGLTNQSSSWLNGIDNSDFNGVRVDSAGDVNGDGYSDVILGVPTTGDVYVFHGSPAGLDTSPGSFWTVSDGPSTTLLGFSVSGAGDVNGDGYSDVLIGQYDYSNGQDLEGRILCYLGSSTGLSATPAWTYEPDVAARHFGQQVAGAGDVDGDGFADLLSGTASDHTGAINGGSIALFLGAQGLGREHRPRQVRSDGVTPVAPGGRTDDPTSMRVRTNLASVFGRTRIRAQHEVRLLTQPFLGAFLVEDANYLDTGVASSLEFDKTIGSLTPGTAYHWRVRTRYDPSSSPLLQRGRWIHAPISGWNEIDLRTAGVPPQAVYCSGDGAGTACPCGNSGPAGVGCLNSLGTGGKLVATGQPSLGADTLVLQGSQMPNSSALYFQGTTMQSAGAGAVFGDGLRCVAGTVIRLASKSNNAGNSQYPSVGDSSISVRGGVTALGTRTYQIWYRNAAVFCTTSTFNLTNGIQVVWGM